VRHVVIIDGYPDPSSGQIIHALADTYAAGPSRSATRWNAPGDGRYGAAAGAHVREGGFGIHPLLFAPQICGQLPRDSARDECRRPHGVRLAGGLAGTLNSRRGSLRESAGCGNER
jgi:hypothetical protein